MKGSFLRFHAFSDQVLAEEFTAVLKEANIEFQLNREPTMLDRQWLGSSSDPDIIIKIRSDDFDRAHQYLQNYFDSHLGEINKEYFLFSFTNEELLEVLHKPDEWGDLNYRLAQKLLADRGITPDYTEVQKMKQERIEELVKPGKTDWGTIAVGYFFLFVCLYLIWRVEAGFAFAPHCCIISLFTGRHLAYNKKILPDGSKTLSYNKESRVQGKIIIAASFLLLCIAIVAWLLFSEPFF